MVKQQYYLDNKQTSAGVIPREPASGHIGLSTHQNDAHLEQVVGNQLIVHPLQEPIRANSSQLVEGNVDDNIVDHALDKPHLHSDDMRIDADLLLSLCVCRRWEGCPRCCALSSFDKQVIHIISSRPRVEK